MSVLPRALLYHGLTLRSIAKQCVSKGEAATGRAALSFETRPAAAPQDEGGERTEQGHKKNGGPKTRRLHSNQTDQLSRKLRSLRERLGCLSLRSALASIWRMRSRVTENCWPTSSSVWSVFMPMPKRVRSTRSSRPVRVATTRVVVSRK